MEYFTVMRTKISAQYVIMWMKLTDKRLSKRHKRVNTSRQNQHAVLEVKTRVTLVLDFDLK